MNDGLIWAKKFFFLLFVPFILFVILGQTAKDVPLPYPSLPTSLSRHLDSLRKADNLGEWLVSWLEYLEDEPAARVSLLYTAESIAWRQPENTDERLAWFDLLANQGYYEMYRGNIDRSIDAYEKAYRFYFEKPIPGAEADVLEYLLKPLGNNYTRLGDYDRAFFIQEKSLSLALQQKDSNQVASIYHNLATSARWKGQFGLAEDYCVKGLMFVHEKTPRHGLLLSTFSEILLLQKKIKEAESRIQNAIKILQQNLPNDTIDVSYWLRGAYQGYGEILKEKGDLTTALRFYEKAELIIDKYFRGERKREKAKLCVLSGQALLHLQQSQKAIEKFNLALGLLLPSFQLQTTDELPFANEIYAENTIMDALHGKATCLLAMGKKEIALDCFMLLFTAERKLRFEFFSSGAKQQQQIENRKWVEAAMQTAYELWKADGKKEYADKMLLIAELSKSQLLLDEMISNLQYSRLKNGDSLLTKQFQIMQAIALAEREAMQHIEKEKKDSAALTVKKEMQYELSLIQKMVKEKYPVFSGYMAEENIPSAENILQKLPSSTVIREFFTGEKNIYIISVQDKTVHGVHRLENAPQVQQAIRDFVFTWFQEGPEKMMNEPQQYYKEANQLYRWLWIDTAKEKQEQYLIIPDGIIGYLPFDALVTDSFYHTNVDDWPFLVKTKNIFFSYSLQTLQQQQQPKKNNKQFAGFFISFDSSTNASLPAVKKEYASLNNLVKGNFFTEKDASLKAFQNQLDKVNLLHISTHSFLQGEENIPVLQLADDKFFLFELYGKSFQPQLVVLSACRTGHGMLAEGEGIISLARGFTATGAGGIVAGLWNMNDESTAGLMGDFYHHLRNDHHPAAALNAAKKEWLKKQHEQYFNMLPYFWAGIIYVGSNQPIELATKKTEIPFMWMVVAAFLLLSGIYYFFKWRKK